MEPLSLWHALIFLMVAAAVAVLSIFQSERKSRKRFNGIFGFDPPLKSDGDEGIRLLKSNVEDEIRELAYCLESGENSIYTAEPKNRLERMRKMREARKHFHQVLNLAQRFGFETGLTTFEYTRGKRQAVD